MNQYIEAARVATGERIFDEMSKNGWSPAQVAADQGVAENEVRNCLFAAGIGFCELCDRWMSKSDLHSVGGIIGACQRCCPDE